MKNSLNSFKILPIFVYSGKLPNKFDALASAVLISSLVCGKRGTERRYLPEIKASKRGIDCITFRRALLNACASLLDSLDLKVLFSRYCFGLHQHLHFKVF